MSDEKLHVLRCPECGRQVYPEVNLHNGRVGHWHPTYTRFVEPEWIEVVPADRPAADAGLRADAQHWIDEDVKNVAEIERLEQSRDALEEVLLPFIEAKPLPGGCDDHYRICVSGDVLRAAKAAYNGTSERPAGDKGLREKLAGDEAITAAMRVWASYTGDTMLAAEKARRALEAAFDAALADSAGRRDGPNIANATNVDAEGESLKENADSFDREEARLDAFDARVALTECQERLAEATIVTDDMVDRANAVLTADGYFGTFPASAMRRALEAALAAPADNSEHHQEIEGSGA